MSPLDAFEAKPTGRCEAETSVGLVCLDTYDDAIGRRIRQLRVDFGLGLREAAKIADLSPGDLSRLEIGEHGLRDPDAALAYLARVWGAP